MRQAKVLGLWALLVLTAVSVISLVALGEITLKQGEAGEAQWWYIGEHDEMLCPQGSLSEFCTEADHWGVELATYADDDWAYVSLYSGKRFTLAAIDEAEISKLERALQIGVALLQGKDVI